MPYFKRKFNKHQFNKKSPDYKRNSRPRKSDFKAERLDNSLFVSKAVSVEPVSLYSSSSFEDFGLHAKIAQNIKTRNYTKPTRIQAEVIKPILEGNDVLGLANTGSGKTAAFLIPLVHKVLARTTSKVLIVAPTRELVNQIQLELRIFTNNTGIRDVLIVGGASYSGQLRILSKNPQFVIATPGRLLDLAKNSHIDLGSFDYVVLDEVDHMLDMGFIHDINEIIKRLKPKRQSMFFSATMSDKAMQLAKAMLINPISVELAEKNAAKNVDQNIVKVDQNKGKVKTLHELLINSDFRRVLVFTRTKHGADALVKNLQQLGHKCDGLHGNKSLNNRTKVLARFKRDEIDVLVATDVASRGIDVPDISHVINFDKPSSYDDYIHRIGRTGRIGKKGIALTFV